MQLSYSISRSTQAHPLSTRTREHDKDGKEQSAAFGGQSNDSSSTGGRSLAFKGLPDERSGQSLIRLGVADQYGPDKRRRLGGEARVNRTWSVTVVCRDCPLSLSLAFASGQR